jgi:hypothetical protein
LPTKALPGSEEKLLVLAARAAARVPLFVAGDAPVLAKKVTGTNATVDLGARYERDKAQALARMKRRQARQRAEREAMKAEETP